MADVDPSLTFMNARTLEQQIALTFDQDRAVASLAGLFGGVSLLLAAIGLYGVTAYSVAQRTNEIGIRMALGADRRDVVRMVMREAGVLLIAGVVVGTVLAIAAARTAATLLFGLHAGDPATLAMAAGGLGLVAMLASYLPALRASRLEPTEALREE
jgi:ABC-type antimicrobial peptide transport system permease subunit